MDLNFLVFPKPSFDTANDRFYSRLVLIPKTGRNGVKNLLTKKSLVISMSKKLPQPEGETALLAPRVLFKKNLDLFGKASNNKKELYLANKPRALRSVHEGSENEDELQPIERNIIRTGEKTVRLPKSGLKSREETQVTDVNESVSFTKQQMNALNSRFAGWVDNQRSPKPPITLSKLMSNLENYRSIKPTLMLKSHLDVKFSRKGSNSSFKSKPNTESIDADDFIVPSEIAATESPVTPARTLTTSTKADRNIFQRKSLHQLNRMFSCKPSAFKRDGTHNFNLSVNTSENEAMTIAERKIVIRPTAERQKTRNPFLSTKNQVINPDGDQKFESPKILASNIINRNFKFNSLITGLKEQGQVMLSKNLLKDREYQQSIKSPGFKATAGMGRVVSATHLNVRNYASNLKVESDSNRAKNLINGGTNEHDSIPCLVIPPESKSDTVLLFFHANGEDLPLSQPFCETLRSYLKVALL